MSNKNTTPPAGPTIKPTVGKIVENSANKQRPSMNQPTKPSIKKGK